MGKPPEFQAGVREFGNPRALPGGGEAPTAGGAPRRVGRSCRRRRILRLSFLPNSWEFGKRASDGPKSRRSEFGNKGDQNLARDTYLSNALGEDAVTLLDRLDGASLRQLEGDTAFTRSSAWGLRRLMASVRDAAAEFARQQGDDEFLAAIERLTDG